MNVTNESVIVILHLQVLVFKKMCQSMGCAQKDKENWDWNNNSSFHQSSCQCPLNRRIRYLFQRGDFLKKSEMFEHSLGLETTF